MKPKLLTIAEASKRLNVSGTTLRRMIRTGEFPPPVRRNSRWVRVPASDIENYLTKLAERRQTEQPRHQADTTGRQLET